MHNYIIRKIKTKKRNNYTHIYIDKNGKTIKKPKLNVYIAPAYRDVRINLNPNAKVLSRLGNEILTNKNGDFGDPSVYNVVLGDKTLRENDKSIEEVQSELRNVASIFYAGSKKTTSERKSIEIE